MSRNHLFSIFAMVIIIVLFINIPVLSPTFKIHDYTNYGNYGGFVGGVFGTSISLVATYLVYITYKSQKDQTNKQTFENTFFQLLKVKSDLSDGVFYENKTGKVAFKFLYEEMIEGYKETVKEHHRGILAPPDNFEPTLEYNEKFFLKNDPSIYHVFMHLYNLLLYIRRTNLIEENSKMFYAEIVRDQLEYHEYWILIGFLTYASDDQLQSVFEDYNFFINPKTLDDNTKDFFRMYQNKYGFIKSNN